jgi:hypothetical protein
MLFYKLKTNKATIGGYRASHHVIDTWRHPLSTPPLIPGAPTSPYPHGIMRRL